MADPYHVAVTLRDPFEVTTFTCGICQREKRIWPGSWEGRETIGDICRSCSFTWGKTESGATNKRDAAILRTVKGIIHAISWEITNGPHSG
jgi:hypothetical protein